MGALLDHIGRACKQARYEADLTQVDIANSAGISTSPISRLENGERLPEEIEAIVDAYAENCGVRPIDLWRQALQRWDEELQE